MQKIINKKLVSIMLAFVMLFTSFGSSFFAAEFPESFQEETEAVLEETADYSESGQNNELMNETAIGTDTESNDAENNPSENNEIEKSEDGSSYENVSTEPFSEKTDVIASEEEQSGSQETEPVSQSKLSWTDNVDTDFSVVKSDDSVFTGDFWLNVYNADDIMQGKSGEEKDEFSEFFKSIATEAYLNRLGLTDVEIENIKEAFCYNRLYFPVTNCNPNDKYNITVNIKNAQMAKDANKNECSFVMFKFDSDMRVSIPSEDDTEAYVLYNEDDTELGVEGVIKKTECPYALMVSVVNDDIIYASEPTADYTDDNDDEFTADYSADEEFISEYLNDNDFGEVEENQTDNSNDTSFVSDYISDEEFEIENSLPDIESDEYVIEEDDEFFPDETEEETCAEYDELFDSDTEYNENEPSEPETDDFFEKTSEPGMFSEKETGMNEVQPDSDFSQTECSEEDSQVFSEISEDVSEISSETQEEETNCLPTVSEDELSVQEKADSLLEKLFGETDVMFTEETKFFSEKETDISSEETESLFEEESESFSEEETETLLNEETEVLSEKETETVSEEKTEALFEEETEMLSEEETETLFEEETEMLSEEETEIQLEVTCPEQVFNSMTDTFSVSVSAPEGAFPEDTSIVLKDVENKEKIEALSDEVEKISNDKTSYVKKLYAIDISFIDKDGNEIEPLIPVKVNIIPLYPDSNHESSHDQAIIIHEESEGIYSEVNYDIEKSEFENSSEENISITEEEQVFFSFETLSFSIYTVAYMDNYIAGEIESDGISYKITVSYDENAMIPSGAELSVSEITKNSETYENYAQTAEHILGIENGLSEQVRLFDISIVKEGKIIQPAEGQTVDVKISRIVSQSNDLNIVHFHDDNGVEIVENTSEETDEGFEISFSTNSFSVYAVVEGPAPAQPPEATVVADMDEFLANFDNEDGFYLYYGPTLYVTSELNSNGAFVESARMLSAAAWHFEKIPGSTNKFYVYTYIDGVKKYMINASGSEMGLAETPSTAFEISQAENGKFYFKVDGSNMWFQHSGSGKGMRLYNSNSNATNTRISMVYVESTLFPDDPYELDGKSYGLLIYADGVNGTAMMGSQNGTALNSQTVIVRNNPVDKSEQLYVARNTDITFWTFRNVSEDNYKIEADNGQYIKIVNNTISLVPESESSVMKVIPGTGSHAGTVMLSAGNKSIEEGTNKDRFVSVNTNVNSDKQYFMLAEKSDFTEEDFVIYDASKVSVSDTEKVTNGSHVVIYTRIWNDSTKKYEFYAVDHDGSLVRCYESGDVIQWVGAKINTMQWNFVEYYYEGTTEPNHYYELYNPYSEKFIAPQINGNVLSDDPIGINMNGRRYGDYYSTILAWDNPYYDYAGLSTNSTDIVSVRMSEAQDFYFAVVNETIDENELTMIDTVDNNKHGITMKMFNFPTAIAQNTFLNNSEFIALEATSGLLSTQLGEDGYPTAAGGSFLNLISNAGLKTVNHLFIESTYEATGYYEFDSSQNFASLKEDNEFDVYSQIGTMDNSNKITLKHGQFMPYNTIVPGVFSSLNGENLYTAVQEPLGDDDPRKYEQLYLVQTPDYYFGMEVEASFTQTPNGKDNWNHDIIYEFTGDDDFWLYVDGELVIDLGGIHSALPGKVNFATGDVDVNGVHKTLRQVFEENYVTRNPGATQSEIDAHLAKFFDDGETIFRPYTSHKMKIFYMERGAGASNLHMRFNLASTKPGLVELDKVVTGTDKYDYASSKFLFQIYFKNGDDWDIVDRSNVDVFYHGTSTPLEYRRTYEGYNNVFLLSPGGRADIMFPGEEIEYYIKECNVSTNIYDSVSVNGTEIEGVSTGTNKSDFLTSELPVSERKKVIYDNHVSPDALRSLSIKKRLVDDKGNELFAEDDSTGFKYRVYIGDDLEYYRFGPYCVKNPDGYYCSYDPDYGFISTGITDFDLMTEAQKISATFHTSMSGAIDQIPVGYVVEIRDLMVDTHFKVEERAEDIPDGYSFREYKRVDGSYIIDPGEDTENEGFIRDNSNPQIEVWNNRGWGLYANKIWSDDSFMSNHDNIYYGIYVGGELLDGSLRIMRAKTDDQNTEAESRYYYYLSSLKSGYTFADYCIREVSVTDPVTDPDGFVTSYTSAVPIDENDTILIGGQEKNGEYKDDSFKYTVTYEKGPIQGSANNVRSDSMINTRDGLKIYKTDYSGNPVSGGRFTITDDFGNAVGADSYTADNFGFVTIAYFLPGETYHLQEEVSPKGYTAIFDDMIIEVDTNGIVSVSGVDSSKYVLTQASSGNMPVLSIKNKTYNLSIIKVDAETNDPIEGVHFSLHRQVEGHTGPTPDYNPVAGYEDVVSDINGIVDIDLDSLPRGGYYLKEKSPPPGYVSLPKELWFTVSERGLIEMREEEQTPWLDSIETHPGEVEYTITIPNSQKATVDVKLSKLVDGNFGNKVEMFQFRLSDFTMPEGRSADGTYDYLKYDESGSVVERGLFIVSSSSSVGKFQAQNSDVQNEIIGLSHKEYVVISGLPQNVSFVSQEIPGSVSAYDTVCHVTSFDGFSIYFDGNNMTSKGNSSGLTISANSGNYKNLEIGNVPEGGIAVTYLNTRNAVIPTNSDTNIYTMIGILLCALFILIFQLKKSALNNRSE